jgi:hypothetical protein
VTKTGKKLYCTYSKTKRKLSNHADGDSCGDLAEAVEESLNSGK